MECRHCLAASERMRWGRPFPSCEHVARSGAGWRSVANASEAYIASVYAHAVAKGTLARAIGEVEQTFVSLVGGKQ